VLGVAKDAEQKAIKDAFRNLAMKYHPDRNKEPGAEERFKEIAEAYAILSDPKKRAEYDARGFAGVAGFSQEDLFSGINFDDIFGGSTSTLAATVHSRDSSIAAAPGLHAVRISRWSCSSRWSGWRAVAKRRFA